MDWERTSELNDKDEVSLIQYVEKWVTKDYSSEIQSFMNMINERIKEFSRTNITKYQYDSAGIKIMHSQLTMIVSTLLLYLKIAILNFQNSHLKNFRL